MDQNKFFANILHEIKQAVIVIVLVLLITANSFAATEITTIEPVPPPTKTELKINAPMVVVFSCLLTAFLLICLFFVYFRHWAERQLALAARTTSYLERPTMKLATARGLDPAVIAEFTSFTYSMVKDIKIGQQVLECAVCLNEFHDHESLRLLPECNHVFHRDCIDKWLAIHITCPVCRASLVRKPSQLSHETELPYGQNGPRKDHVSVEVDTLKHDLSPPRKLYRSCSMGHPIVDQTIGNVEQYTLRLPEEVQNILKNTACTNRTDVSLLQENSFKTSLRSASANFVRGTDYFDYERFGQERRSGGRNFGITDSFISSRSGTSNDGKDLSSTSKRLLSSVMSASNLFQISNKDNDMIMRLNDCSR